MCKGPYAVGTNEACIWSSLRQHCLDLQKIPNCCEHLASYVDSSTVSFGNQCIASLTPPDIDRSHVLWERVTMHAGWISAQEIPGKGAFKKLCFIAEIKSGINLTSFRDSNQTVYINWVCGTQFSHYTGLDIVVHASVEALRGYINIKSSRQPLFSSIAPHFTHLSSYTGTLTSRTRPEYTKISVVCSIPREYFA